MYSSELLEPSIAFCSIAESPLEQPIAHLDWSSDGKFLACVETAGRIVVKHVHPGKSLAWTAQPVFEVRVAVSPQGVQQVLLNHNGTIVLIKNGPMVTIQNVKSTVANKDPITVNSVGDQMDTTSNRPWAAIVLQPRVCPSAQMG